MAAGAPPAVQLRGIVKRFPGGVLANDAVDLDLRLGEIHALVGENGAGKSTLMNVLFGIYPPDSGEILLHGEPVRHRSPAEALENGVAMVHQHFRLVPSFTVLENMLLARADRGVRLRSRQVRAEIVAAADRYKLRMDPDAVVGSLPLGAQQRVEVLKALLLDATVLVLDEPTTVLNPAETEALFEVLTLIRDENRAVVMISHHLEEVFRIADRVTVLRAGARVGTAPASELDRATVARMVVGRDVEALSLRSRAAHIPGGAPVLKLKDVSVASSATSPGLADVNLEVHAGEIVAIAGVEGNGQRALFDLVAGSIQPTSGTVELGARRGVRLVPEDRHAEALFSTLSVAENLVIDRVGRPPLSRAGVLDRQAIDGEAVALIARFNIRAPGPAARARTLSGGNQQKLVLARALSAATELLVVHQPTRGLDIGATSEVLDTVAAAARDGAGVLFISNSLDEIFAMGDRIVVLHRGVVTGQAPAETVGREQVGRWMTGERQAA